MKLTEAYREHYLRTIADMTVTELREEMDWQEHWIWTEDEELHGALLALCEAQLAGLNPVLPVESTARDCVHFDMG